MKNTCPECGTAYNVANAPVGRKFTCKKCSTPVVVTEEGLDYLNPPAKAAPAAAPAPAGGAFEFDDAADEAPKPPKGAKAKSKGRPRDEEEPTDDEDDAPRKPKKKPARARDLDESADTEVEDDRPARRARAKPRGDERSFIADLISFAGPTAPSFVRTLFLAYAGAVVVLGLIGFIAVLATSTSTEAILAALFLVGAWLSSGLFLGRVLSELTVVGFVTLTRFNELKAELEKANAVLANPLAPSQPATTQPAPAAPAAVLAAPTAPVAPPADSPLV